MQGTNRKGLDKPPRVKRTVLGSRTGAPTTPVPRWKVLSDQLDEFDGIAMAATSANRIGPVVPPAPSARKFAASLWDLQDLSFPDCSPACLFSPNLIPYNSSPPGASLLEHSSPWSQPDYVLSPTSFKSASQRHLKTRVNKGRLHRLLTGKPSGDTGDFTTAASIVVDGKQRHIPCALFATTGTDEVESGHNVTTSQELLKVFSQIRILEEQHHQSLNLTTALHAELMQAHARMRELELPDRLARREVEDLMKRFSDERMSWKVKEKEKVKAAVQSVEEELEEERKEKNRLQGDNHGLKKELTESQAATAKALHELEHERKRRHLMEEVCNEITQETENDKRQLQQVQEALEEERRMLQLAEVWREERVQMKLGEARLALETKSATLDVMRAELESFLTTKRNGDKHDNTTFRDAQVLHSVVSAVRYDTSISTFPPTSSMSSVSSNFPFPATSEYMYGATIDTDSSQDSRDHGHALLYYPEGVRMQISSHKGDEGRETWFSNQYRYTTHERMQSR